MISQLVTLYANVMERLFLEKIRDVGLSACVDSADLTLVVLFDENNGDPKAEKHANYLCFVLARPQKYCSVWMRAGWNMCAQPSVKLASHWAPSNCVAFGSAP